MSVEVFNHIAEQDKKTGKWSYKVKDQLPVKFHKTGKEQPQFNVQLELEKTFQTNYDKMLGKMLATIAKKALTV